MASIVDRWIEEDYFTSLCIIMDNIGIHEGRIEDAVHEIMDAHTHDGVLDTDTLDKVIDEMIGTEEDN